jgi:hypothetical protein
MPTFAPGLVRHAARSAQRRAILMHTSLRCASHSARARTDRADNAGLCHARLRVGLRAAQECVRALVRRRPAAKLCRRHSSDVARKTNVRSVIALDAST